MHKVREVTLRHDLHALSLLFQYGMKHQWCRSNPIEGVEIPSDAKAVRMIVLTEEEEARLFFAIDSMVVEHEVKHGPKQARALRDIRDLALLMLNQGCRPEELRELPQALVDLEKGVFTIEHGKSDAARRTLPMTLASRGIIAARMNGGRWVFPSQKHPGQHIGQHRRMWTAIVKRSEINGLVLYDCRHTFATRAVERGVPLPQLMAILGHANLRSIMRYVHMSQAHIESGMRRFEEKSGPTLGQDAGRNPGFSTGPNEATDKLQ